MGMFKPSVAYVLCQCYFWVHSGCNLPKLHTSWLDLNITILLRYRGHGLDSLCKWFWKYVKKRDPTSFWMCFDPTTKSKCERINSWSKGLFYSIKCEWGKCQENHMIETSRDYDEFCLYIWGERTFFLCLLSYSKHISPTSGPNIVRQPLMIQYGQFLVHKRSWVPLQ